jgi:hypothetical protein
MRRRNHGRRNNHRHGDTTRNFKMFRLVIHWPGQPVRHFTVDSKKTLRTLRDTYLAKGATVEEQEHVGWDRYRTIKVHPAVPRTRAGER